MIPKQLWGGVLAALALSGCSAPSIEEPATPPVADPSAKATAKTEPAPVLQLVPADAAGFVHIRVADLWNCAALGELRSLHDKAGTQTLQLFEQKYAPAPSQIESLTLILLTAESVNTPIFDSLIDRVSPVLAVTTKKPFDQAQLAKAFGTDAQPARHNEHGYFRAANNTAWQFVDDRTFVVASAKGLERWLDRPGRTAKQGALADALREANRNHTWTAGFNPRTLPQEPFGPFQPAAPFKSVAPGIGGPPRDPVPPRRPVQAPTNELWASFAQPLLKARCLTVTVDADAALHAAAKLDFDSDSDADNGAKAVNAGVRAARASLAAAADDLQRDLRDGPKLFSPIGQPPPKQPAGPRALIREADQAIGDIATCVQIGVLRSLDEQLHKMAVQRQDNSVRVQADVPLNGNTLLLAFTAISSLGRTANSTFQSVGETIGPAPGTLQPPTQPKQFEPVK